MIASLHLIEYAQRVFSPPTSRATRTAGPCFWRPLHFGHDIGWFREHQGRWEVYRHLLLPNFRRWAFYAVWDDEAAIDTFLQSSEPARRWREARNACHFWLRPQYLRGRWQGARLLRGSESPGPAAGPIAYLTRTELSPRGALAFWASGAPYLSHYLPDNDDMPFAVALADRPYMHMLVFSIWRSSDSAMNFAYREPGHPHAVGRVRRGQRDLVERFSAARFQPYRREGTWPGMPAAAGVGRR